MDSATSTEPKLESTVPPPNGVHSLDLAYCFIRCLELEISRPKLKFLPWACHLLLDYNINRYSGVQTTVVKVKQAARHTEDWEGQDKYIVDIKALETSLKDIVEKFESMPKEALLGDIAAGHSPPLDSYEASFDSLRKLRDAIYDFGKREKGSCICDSSIINEYIKYILQSIECGVESCFMKKPICPTSNVQEPGNSKGVSEKFGRLKDGLWREPVQLRASILILKLPVAVDEVDVYNLSLFQEHTVENVLWYLLTLTRGYDSGYESSELFVAEVKCQLFDSYLNTILQLFDIKEILRHLYAEAQESDKKVKLGEIYHKFYTTIISVLQKSIGEQFELEIRNTVWETLASLAKLGTLVEMYTHVSHLKPISINWSSSCFHVPETWTNIGCTRSVKIKVPPALTRILPDVQRPFFEECIEYSRICRELTEVYDLKKRTDSLAINLQGFVEEAYGVLKKAKALSVPLTEVGHGRMCATLFRPLKNQLTRLRDDTPKFSGWDKAVKAVDEARERDISTFRELRMRMTYLFGENNAIPATESDQEVDETEGRWCEVEIDVPGMVDMVEIRPIPLTIERILPPAKAP